MRHFPRKKFVFSPLIILKINLFICFECQFVNIISELLKKNLQFIYNLSNLLQMHHILLWATCDYEDGGSKFPRADVYDQCVYIFRL